MQTYTIFCNQTSIQLQHVTVFTPEKVQITRFEAPYTTVASALNEALAAEKAQIMVWQSSNIEALLTTIESIAEPIVAAGGVVLNQNEELLMIHRLGFWDLPKGKTEKGEMLPETAVREVQEETGIMAALTGKELPTTRHIFRNQKGNLKMKVSYWFEMRCDKSQELIPQVEEQITAIQWVSWASYPLFAAKAYPSIQWLINSYKTTNSF